MGKIRVFQIATELNYDKQKLIGLCKDAGLPVKSPLSSVDETTAEKIRSLVNRKAEIKEPKKDNVIRSMKDLPSISSDDLEKGKVRFSSNSDSKTATPAKKAEQAPAKKQAAPAHTPKKTAAQGHSSAKSAPAQEKPQENRPATHPPFDPNQNRPKKKAAMTEFERQQAKIQKRKKLKEKQAAREERQKVRAIEAERLATTLQLGDGVSVAELATNMGVEPTELISKLFSMGIMSTINQRLDLETCEILAAEYGFSVEQEVGDDDVLAEIEFEDSEEELQPREPIVTVMGHVDHGKTTLLDYIRHAHVADGEAGGITQHIGAYKVKTSTGNSVCFLDTPGHEAFTAMRAHGSQITDIAILVIAADDGVKPQTIEAINHAKNADVPIIVAITKCDKPDVNLEKVYEGLGANGLVVEAWGGNVVSQAVSGKTGEGVGELLELVSIQSELLELKANPDRSGIGVIVEAGMKKGRGSVATVLVQNGSVNVGDVMVSGTAMGRVRSMTNERGKRVKEAGPSTPVEIAGFSEVPQFADKFYIVENEKVGRQLIERREARIKKMKAATPDKVVNLESLFAAVEQGKIKELNVVVKADVHGSVVALTENLEKISRDEVKVKVVHSGVGAVSETDVMLASAASAVIICFHVRADSKVKTMADELKVEIRNYRIIYDAINDVKQALIGMLEPEFKEVQLGKAVVKDVFSISKVGKIAGCFVETGKIVRGKSARIIRDGVEVYEGQIASLARFKDSVTEVLSGYECGIGLDYTDIKPQDVIEVFEMEEIPIEA